MAAQRRANSSDHGPRSRGTRTAAVGGFRASMPGRDVTAWTADPRSASRTRALAGLAAGCMLAFVLLTPLTAISQETAQTPSADRLLAAVVGVRARVPDDARTATTLGTLREGSGIVIDASGLIVTIGYLILEASHVDVVVSDDVVVAAEVLAYDNQTGFGLLRASEPLDVTPMRLGTSASLTQGDPLLIAGFGGPLTARAALLVSRRDFAGYWEYLLEDAIFTSPPYPGFGGAALVNAGGELVGIGSLAVADAYDGDQPLPENMFVPVDRLKGVLADLLTSGRSSRPSRPWLGIYTSEIDGLLMVRRLAVDGPAEGAGVQPGDIIVGVAGQPVESMADFYRKLWAAGVPGDSVSLTILKGTRMHELDVTAGDRYDWLRLK